MPTYEYKCLDCERRFEAFQNMSDEPLAECEACGGRLKRLIGTGAGIIFKGSGFYATDYRSESYRSAAKKDKESVSTTSDKTSAGSAKKGGSDKKASTSTKAAEK